MKMEKIYLAVAYDIYTDTYTIIASDDMHNPSGLEGCYPLTKDNALKLLESLKSILD